MSALISGSFAFDTIMAFPESFNSHILADKLDMLNVSFLVPDMRREFGGCAGNIAYNLQLLGDTPLPIGTVGKDFAPYTSWLQSQGINLDHVLSLDQCYTAQAFITTDAKGNQITAFHPGAMNFSHELTIPETSDIELAIVAPDGRQGMIDRAQQLADRQIPFIFDPGQGLPMFDGESLKHFAEQANYIALNEYESQLFQQRTGMSEGQIAEQVEALIVTLGGQGSVIYHDGVKTEIPCAPISQANDPTGCGDAYRAGLIHGILNQKDWPTTGRIASLMGAIKIEQHGTQNHRFDLAQFEQRYQQSFDSSWR